jgi:predicted nucleotide-binding protein
MAKKQEEELGFLLGEPNKEEVFVGFPFTPKLFNKTNFKKQIKKVLRESGFQPYFYDDHHDSSNIVMLKLFYKIRSSNFAVFDLSDGNPNVLIELGYSLGANKKMFILKHKGSDFEVPSDINSIEIIYYDDIIDLEYKLKHAIREVFHVKKRGKSK